ncbi:ornithine aminomutase subunit alpha [Sporomusa sp.]|uniref:ornithine aminomutase subunit alpha n=1 Tax=Sporomusa sp. TaxID=2078658 RepID=UPI002BF9A2B9|nr:ornithine aminomutase subunit alpha [Sporomusa sp.]HWR42735.1 ornithine aminomutase subunit alpha [Sporomusa sp.]
MQRQDDFSRRRAGLAALSDAQLKERFWQLTEQVVQPLVELARTHTSPSVERSVLLRMGFSSIEAKEIVDKCVEKELLGKGAGHAVWRVAQLENISYREAGLRLAQGLGWDRLQEFWQKGETAHDSES